jgi:fucose permease
MMKETRRAPSTLLVALAFIAFISLGLPDGLLGVAWPSIRAEFGRPLNQVGWLLAAGVVGYLTSSFLAGQLVRVLGLGRVLVASSLLVTTALTGYFLSPTWGLVVFFALLGGLGGGAIDAGINTFAASRFSPRVVNWLHAFWGVGASTGPLLMTAVLAGHLDWQIGYGIVAEVLGLLAILFIFTVRFWGTETPVGPAVAAVEPTATLSQALARPIVWFQIAIFFIYGGIETSAGTFFYTLLTKARDIDLKVAGVTVGGYWAALTVGRFLFGQLSARWGALAMLRIGLVLACAAAGLFVWNPTPALGLSGAVLLGLGLAPIYPMLISVTPGRVGRFYAPQSIGFQVAAAGFGNVALPYLIATVAEFAGLEVLGVFLVGGSIVLLVIQETTTRLARRSPAQI